MLQEVLRRECRKRDPLARCGTWAPTAAPRGPCLTNAPVRLGRLRTTGACFIVRAHGGQALAYLYYENEPGRRAAANLMTPDEARRIAINIAMLPKLLKRPQHWLRFGWETNEKPKLCEAWPERYCHLVPENLCLTLNTPPPVVSVTRAPSGSKAAPSASAAARI